ncbi:hypothetical protein [Aestuariibius sp. HNIBRBA575]|uniref:hypothetical protein n=1 Tax=Aestuariibius sp. HNIBRBA575 TaxID=3233343 RepID=UPI0034A3D04E
MFRLIIRFVPWWLFICIGGLICFLAADTFEDTLTKQTELATASYQHPPASVRPENWQATPVFGTLNEVSLLLNADLTYPVIETSVANLLSHYVIIPGQDVLFAVQAESMTAPAFHHNLNLTTGSPGGPVLKAFWLRSETETRVVARHLAELGAPSDMEVVVLSPYWGTRADALQDLRFENWFDLLFLPVIALVFSLMGVVKLRRWRTRRPTRKAIAARPSPEQTQVAMPGLQGQSLSELTKTRPGKSQDPFAEGPIKSRRRERNVI